MSDPNETFARDYTAALSRHLAENSEACLHRAYVLGRRALDGVLGVLDLTHIHHQALAEVLDADLEVPVDTKTRLERAAAFFAECLSPFEMTLLGVREANTRLIQLNTELERANSETRAAHETLKAETADRVRMEDVVRQAQQLQAIGRLAGGVAHHFNNLLTVVLGNLEIARGRIQAGDPIVPNLNRAKEAAQRAATVTRQLLTFSGQQLLRSAEYDPTVRLPDFASLLGGSLGGAITIESDIPKGLWPIKVDANELELAILNLAINARDAMPNGGRLRIVAANRTVRDARLGLDGDYLTIEMTDTGTGIEPEVLSKVFDPFFTTKGVGVGTGLGLSQVHGFARQSSGAVDIESVVGAGTTVRLFIPAIHQAAQAAPHDSAVSAPGRGVVLVVEDDVDVAEIAAAILDSFGFGVRLANHAQAALDLLNQGEKVDLVFSDIVMPGGISGIDLADRLRRDYPHIPVLLATGYSDKFGAAADRGLQIITKPYESDELRERVLALLAA